MKIHILNCGYIRIHEDLLYGGGNVMTDFRKAVMASDSRRVTLPVFAYLIEHPSGLFLVDTGWSRGISPNGVYDPKRSEGNCLRILHRCTALSFQKARR